MPNALYLASSQLSFKLSANKTFKFLLNGGDSSGWGWRAGALEDGRMGAEDQEAEAEEEAEEGHNESV